MTAVHTLAVATTHEIAPVISQQWWEILANSVQVRILHVGPSLRYLMPLLIQIPSAALLFGAISYHKLLTRIYCFCYNTDEGTGLILTVELFSSSSEQYAL